MESRVLVMGATGLVGRAIVRALLGGKYPVRMLVRDSELACALFGAHVEISTGEIRDLQCVRLVCAGIGTLGYVPRADTRARLEAEIRGAEAAALSLPTVTVQ